MVMEKSHWLIENKAKGRAQWESKQSSHHSKSSENINSFQEEMDQINPWDRIQGETFGRHKGRFHDLLNEYEQNGDCSEITRVKADNALLHAYRKELRKVFSEYLQWMNAMGKDSTFQKVMQTQQDLKDTEECDWREPTELAIDKPNSS